jgi:adenylate cyclase
MKIFPSGPQGPIRPFSSRSVSVLIGRQLPRKSDTLGLDDAKVSANHARLSFEKGEYWIEDLGSMNGTWIDMRRIKPHEKIKFPKTAAILVGTTTLRLEEPSPEEAAAPPSEPADDGSARSLKGAVQAGQSLSELYLSGSSQETARARLAEMCELSAALSGAETAEAVAAAVADHLQRSFPRAGKGTHYGILLGDDLVLKAFRPEDAPPTPSLALARQAIARREAGLWEIDASGPEDKSASIVRTGIQTAMYAPLLWKGEALGVLYTDTTSLKSPFCPDDLKLLQAIAAHAAMSLKSLALQRTLQREESVRTRLLAQFPRPVAERLARQPGRLFLASERVEPATIMFSDVRGFTSLTAKLEPEEAVQMLNDMFQELTPIVLKHGGTVDKYIGDALLAVFGSPDPDEKQWEHAVRSALEMQEAVKRLAGSRWSSKVAFKIGIGIHTGPLIHGFIGAPERMDYTVIGNTINLASRISDGAGPGEILISPDAYARIHDAIEVELPPRVFETKHEGPMKAYRVIRWGTSQDAKQG